MKINQTKVTILIFFSAITILSFKLGFNPFKKNPETNFTLELAIYGGKLPKQEKWYLSKNSKSGNLVPVNLVSGDCDLEKVTFINFKNGKARFKGKITRPGLHVLSNTKGHCGAVFMLDSGYQKIEIQYDDFTRKKTHFEFVPIKYDGSSLNGELIEFRNRPETKNDELTSLSLSKSRESKIRIKELREDLALDYLKLNPNSYVALDYFLLFVFSSNFNYLGFEELNEYILFFGKNLKQTQVFTNISEKLEVENRFRVGKKVPDFTFPSATGDNVRNTDFLGNVTLVHLWQIGCSYCPNENENIISLYSKYQQEDFEILSLSFEHDNQIWHDYLNENSSPWIYINDTSDYSNSPFLKIYGRLGIPSSFLLDKEGKLIAKNLRCPVYSINEEINLNRQLEKVFGY